jgi:capsular exopolysaccharide synthesis family protein
MKGGHCEPHTPEAEKIRQLRTQALLLSTSGRLKTLLVTSPQSGDGKTVVTANLGTALAVGDLDVVIIDADLRNPALHEWFDQPNLDGLADLLDADEDMLENLIPQHLRETHVPGLSLLSAGNLPQDPSLLLTSPNFITLLRLLSDQFDMVLLDSPPILRAPDSTILARLVEGTLLVFSPTITSRMAAKQAIGNLNSRDDIHIIGVALNRMRFPISSFHSLVHF